MKIDPRMEKYRSSGKKGCDGYFMVAGNEMGIGLKEQVVIVASSGEGWDHVSVSMRSRTPSWELMCRVKAMFFDQDDWVLQYHPANKDYVNLCGNALHLWRPQKQEIPKPPVWMV